MLSSNSLLLSSCSLLSCSMCHWAFDWAVWALLLALLATSAIRSAWSKSTLSCLQIQTCINCCNIKIIRMCYMANWRGEICVNAVRVNAVRSILEGKRSLQAHHSCIVTHVYPCGACKVNIGSAMSCMCMHLCEGCESSATWCQTIQQNSCCSDTRQWHILLDVLIGLHTLCMASTSVQCFQACECKPESRSTSCQTHMQGLRNSDIGKLTCARCPLLCLHPSWLS